MGFFDVVKSVGGAVASQAKEDAERYNHNVERYSDKSDEILMRKARSGDAAAMKVLKDRGYNRDDIGI